MQEDMHMNSSHTSTRRQALQTLAALGTATGWTALARAQGSATKPQVLRLGYQKSSTLAVVLKTRGTLEQLLAPLQAKVSWHEFTSGLPLLEDLAEPGIALPGWPTLITQQIGQCCAAWFDHEQADWRPDAGVGLYQAWRSSMLRMGLVTHAFT